MTRRRLGPSRHGLLAWGAVLAAVLALTTVARADGIDIRPAKRIRPPVPLVAIHPAPLPPCVEYINAVLLHCVPREYFVPAFDDVVAQNYLRAINPRPPQPYVRTFQW